MQSNRGASKETTPLLRHPEKKSSFAYFLELLKSIRVGDVNHSQQILAAAADIGVVAPHEDMTIYRLTQIAERLKRDEDNAPLTQHCRLFCCIRDIEDDDTPPSPQHSPTP